MITIKKEFIDRVTETIYNIINGNNVEKIVLPAHDEYNEFYQMVDYFNTFISDYNHLLPFVKDLSEGNLNVNAPKIKINALQLLKNLQANLKHLTWKTQQIAGGDLNQKVDFIGDFSVAFNKMTSQLKESFEKIENQNKKIIEHNKEIKKLNLQMKNELNLAKDIQSSLITLDKIKIKNFDIGFKYYPSEYLGGDFMEIKPINDNLFGFFISDVCGHGLVSSLFTFMIKTAFNFWSLDNYSPSSVLKMMNNDLINQITEEYYFTAGYGILNLQTQSFIYSSGGHAKPVLFNSKSKKTSIIDISGFPLCLFSEEEYNESEEVSIKFQNNDMLFLFTDGVVEASNEKNELFDYKRLCSLIENNYQKSSQQIIDIIIDEINLFTEKSTEENDDIAILCLTYTNKDG